MYRPCRPTDARKPALQHQQRNRLPAYDPLVGYTRSAKLSNVFVLELVSQNIVNWLRTSRLQKNIQRGLCK